MLSVAQPSSTGQAVTKESLNTEEFSRLLNDEILEKVNRPGQYLGNEWGAYRKPWADASVRMALAFPDIYELGMSNFGQRILYGLINKTPGFLADRTYAPGSDLETILRERKLPLWGWETRKQLSEFDLIGFSLQYELTYTNVLNMLEMSGIPVIATERENIFPLVFGGGPSAVNPEPMALFLDFFVIGDGEEVLPKIMEVVRDFKLKHNIEPDGNASSAELRQELLLTLAQKIPGIYAPAFYEKTEASAYVKPKDGFNVPELVLRQVCPLNDDNQPVEGPISFLNLVHDRQVLEVRRGCDRGCRFCQPGYTFLPVRERSVDDLLKLSKQALSNSGHQEYSMLSLCVSDYTALHESVRALNQENQDRRASLSFPSQRADRMNLEIAEELKAVRKSGITLAPEAGTERLRAVINKGLNHQQIISAIDSAYQSGWQAVKLYFMIGLPTEEDADLKGIVDILKEATQRCRAMRKNNPGQHKGDIQITCTLSNTVPKPFTPFQWFGQITPEETLRKQSVMKQFLRESGLRNVRLNFTQPQTSLLEAVISRGDRQVGELILRAWQKGAVFDAWDDRFVASRWHEAAADMGLSLQSLACDDRTVGSDQPWDIVHIGLNNWWLVREWQRAMSVVETAPCTENTCHACGVCTELETTHVLAKVKPEQLKKNPFVKELAAHKEEDSHPSLFFMKPEAEPSNKAVMKIRVELTKTNEMRFISHLDMQHLLVRACRRANVHIAYTEGFNPSPKLAQAQALPLGQESTGEIAEIELAEEVDVDQFAAQVNAKLPADMQILRAKVVSLSAPSLASIVGRARYKAVLIPDAKFKNNAPEIQEKVCTLQSASEILISQPTAAAKAKNKAAGKHQVDSYRENEMESRDIKSGVHDFQVTSQSPLTVEMELSVGSKMHIKPQDLLNLLIDPKLDPEVNWRVSRLGLASPDGIPLFELA